MVPAQEMAKSTMEKAANCDRIRGKLNNHCWSRLASSSEAVQYEVFKDINNAISKPEWQLDNLSIWTKNCIHRQTARLRRSAKKATEFTTRSAHALLYTMSSILCEVLSYRCDLSESMLCRAF